MKKILALLFILLLFSACKKLEDLNENVKDPTVVSGESLFTGAQKNIFDQMVSTNVNMNVFRMFAQYWTETTYTDESNYDLVTRTIPDNHWEVMYRDVLKDLKESSKIIEATDYTLTDASPNVKKNRLAVVEVMSIYAWSVLVETFGDVPYTDALDIEKPLPKYDDGLTIYKALIARLDVAIANMDPTYGSLGEADNMYQGDITQWLKFANSLKLHMGLLIADIPGEGTFAQNVVEQAAPGVFTSNADNARLVYLSAQPNTNPIYDDLVASGRHDFVPTSVIIDPMNTLNDPRRPFYFTELGGVYVGGEYGASNDYTSFSHVSDMIQVPNFEGLIFDYSQVEFLLAEAAERGYAVGGTAASHYDKGIEASILYWGGTSTEVTTYLAQVDVAYATATGTYKQKIGTQMWFALYNRGFEAWTSWRKFDYPALVAPVDAFSDIPVRYTYPIAEQTLNGTNYQNASTNIGGDDVADRKSVV